jgi:riboflavin biosynthesis pyrimidine reductase
MKPHVICHMVTSIDGRTRRSRWRPQPGGGDLFERLHDKLGGDAWVVGRVTGQEFAKREAYPTQTDAVFPRETWIAKRGAPVWGVALDTQGRIAWGRSDIGGDPILVVLTEQVSDAHLAGLRSENISYVFAGKRTIDLAVALEVLNRELGIRRLLLEGGGTVNGGFLRAGLVDEISLALQPAVDGSKGVSSVFDSSVEDAGKLAPLTSMTLESCEVLEGGAVWLRYRLRN